MAEPAASPSSALPEHAAHAAPTAPMALAELLAEWHALGGHRAEPVRFALVEALARRAGAHEGAARDWLDARLETLVADLRLRLAGRGVLPAGQDAAAPDAPPHAPAPAARPAPAAPARGELGRLADAVAGHADIADGAVTHRLMEFSQPAPGRRAAPGSRSGKPATPRGIAAVDVPAGTLPSASLGGGNAAQAGAPRELASVQRFRGTWSRLSADERLRQTLAQVPPQAGPLNALHLLHRALVGMQAISPDYLQHFVAHVDALLWLEQVHAASLAVPAARAGARRKPVVRKR